MEDYIGKICPFCKTEIKDGDAVKVCPACGIPHHEGCWEENKGCTIFGCSEQHYEEQRTNPTDVCPNCGTSLGVEQDFCPNCGTPKNAPQKNICGKCGAELQEGQEFCSKCGQKVGLTVDVNVNSAINQFNAGVNKTNNKKKKTPIVVAVAVIVVILLAVGAKIIGPKIFISVDDLCVQGNYEKAYEKASRDEKNEVLAENVVAYLSARSADDLKDPSSLSLRDAYYYPASQYVVLYINGANSYGAIVGSYWLYTYSDDKKEFQYFCSVSDLSDEEYSKYDNDDEKLEKFLNNLGRTCIKTAMSEGMKLNKASIKNINDLFETDILNDVKLLDVEFTKTESDSTDSIG